MSRLLFPVMMFCATACVEEVGMFNGEDERGLIVIDAAISTADSLQYVYISHGGEWSDPEVRYWEQPIYDVVDTRLVTLTDDRGRGDTFFCAVGPSPGIPTSSQSASTPGGWLFDDYVEE